MTGTGPLEPADARPLDPLPADLGREALRETGPAFVEWLRDSGTEVSSDAVLGNLGHVLGVVLWPRAAGRTEGTRFGAEEVERAVHDVVPLLVRESDLPAEAADVLVDALHDYLEFLDETGRWTGSAEEFAACHEILHDHAEPGLELDQQTLDLIGEVGAAEEDEALLASLPVRTAVSLFRQAREGLDLAGEEAVQAAFLRAAEEVGRPAQSVEEVPWVVVVWWVMAHAGLVEAGDEGDDTRTSTPAGLDLADDSEAAREWRREIVGRLVRDDPAADGPWPVGVVTPYLLVASTAGEVVDTEFVRATLATVSPDEERNRLALEEVERHLAFLGSMGITGPAEPWTVERGFRPAVLWGLETSPEV